MARVDPGELYRFVPKVLQGLGFPTEDAEIAARVLVMPDLRAGDSHGVVRLNPDNRYVKAPRDGQVIPGLPHPWQPAGESYKSPPGFFSSTDVDYFFSISLRHSLA
jgi:hypothetical protein